MPLLVPVLLGLFPYNKPEAEILKVQIGDMFLYAPEASWGRGVVFSAEPGERIEDFEVTVQRFLQLRGKVLKMDGSPLANAQHIKFSIRKLSLDGEYDSSGSLSVETDIEGNFVQDMHRYMGGPAFYIMSVTYQEHQAQLDPIVVKPEDLMHEIVFTFEVPLSPDMPRNAPSRFPCWRISAIWWRGLTRKVYGSSIQQMVTPTKKSVLAAWRMLSRKQRKKMLTWSLLTDAAEQNWLEQVFVAHRALIGLSDVEEEGHWQWHSGEPVTYTNWAMDEPNDTGKGDEDYVILFANQWVDIGSGDVRLRFIQSVLLEKEETSLKK